MGERFLSKKEKNKLVDLINRTRWGDEDSVFDCAVELCRVSVRLRAEILSRHEFDDV